MPARSLRPARALSRERRRGPLPHLRERPEPGPRRQRRDRRPRAAEFRHLYRCGHRGRRRRSRLHVRPAEDHRRGDGVHHPGRSLRDRSRVQRPGRLSGRIVLQRRHRLLHAHHPADLPHERQRLPVRCRLHGGARHGRCAGARQRRRRRSGRARQLPRDRQPGASRRRSRQHRRCLRRRDVGCLPPAAA